MKDDIIAKATNTHERELITLSDLHSKFGWEEYLVLAATLSISALIGVFWAWRSRKVKENFEIYLKPILIICVW